MPAATAVVPGITGICVVPGSLRTCPLRSTSWVSRGLIHCGKPTAAARDWRATGRAMPGAESGDSAGACASGFLLGLSVGNREARTDSECGELKNSSFARGTEGSNPAPSAIFCNII